MTTHADNEKPNFQVPNLERALQILEYLVDQEEELSQREIALTMGFPVNSVMRILNALEYYGYIDRNSANKKYTLSNKLSTMGRSSAVQRSLLESSLDVMRELRDQVKETVVISVLDDDCGLILDQIQGTHAFRFVCEPGTRQAMHCSASTKVILAFMPEKDSDAVIEKINFEKYTSTTITSADAFRKELEQVKKDGFGFDRSEAIEGVNCTAAPILDHSGNAIAAITTTGPSNRMTLAELEKAALVVKEYTAKISLRMGYVPR